MFRRAGPIAAALGLLWSLGMAGAVAGCAPGETPDGSDVSAIRVRRYSFPVRREPMFELVMRRDLRFDQRTRADRVITSASLRALGLRPVTRGYYELDGDAELFFAAVLAALERAGFSSLRLTPQNAAYIDGPASGIAVDRCSTRTIVSTTLDPFRWLDLDDENAKRFFRALDDVGALVEGASWKRVPDPAATLPPYFR